MSQFDQGGSNRPVSVPSLSSVAPLDEDSLAKRVRVAWTVEDVGAGAQYPVFTDRFRIGGNVDDDLFVPGLGRAAITLMFQPNGEIWLGQEDKLLEIAAEEPFDAGGATIVVRTVFDNAARPRDLLEIPYPYAVTVRVLGGGVPFALIEDLLTGTRHRLGGESAMLLSLLARRRLEDEAAGIEAFEVGWSDIHDLMVGLWGSGGEEAPPSRLALLACNVRQGLREAGFDPWFMERRRGGVRLGAVEIRVDAPIDPSEVPTEHNLDVRDLLAEEDLPAPEVLPEDDRPTEPTAGNRAGSVLQRDPQRAE